MSSTCPESPVPIVVAIGVGPGRGSPPISPTGSSRPIPTRTSSAPTRMPGDRGRIRRGPARLGPDADAAAASAHRMFRFGLLSWKVLAELANPINFEAAAEFIDVEDVRRAFACGPDVDRHVEVAREYAEAGFDHLALVNADPTRTGSSPSSPTSCRAAASDRARPLRPGPRERGASPSRCATILVRRRRPRCSADHVDVLIVGAGLSGIGAGYHLQAGVPAEDLRDPRGARLDRRDSGTCSATRGFARPDMYTLGYRFRPWPDAKAIADGPSILQYVRDTAGEHGIDRKIRLAIEWSAPSGRPRARAGPSRPSGPIRARRFG